MNLGLDMIQFNIVDAVTLRDAQRHPERYQDLVVRVSGYNAKFVEMDRFVQDAVIERTEHDLP
jgi:pyruvate-formate lyase